MFSRNLHVHLCQDEKGKRGDAGNGQGDRDPEEPADDEGREETEDSEEEEPCRQKEDAEPDDAGGSPFLLPADSVPGEEKGPDPCQDDAPPADESDSRSG